MGPMLRRLFIARRDVQAATMATVNIAVVVGWWQLDVAGLAAINIAIGLWLVAAGSIAGARDLNDLQAAVDAEVLATLREADRRRQVLDKAERSEAGLEVERWRTGPPRPPPGAPDTSAG